jgi:hypothetical protein
MLPGVSRIGAVFTSFVDATGDALEPGQCFFEEKKTEGGF